MGKKRHKLLVIGAVPPPYVGPSIATQEILASKVIAQDFEIVFCDISDHRELESMGHFDWRNVWLGLGHVAKCCALLLYRRPQLVYFGVSQGLWGYLRDLGFLIPAALLRKKIVMHLRGSEFDAFYAQMPPAIRGLTRLLFKRIACAVVLSERLKPVFGGLVPADRIQVAPNGIDCEFFRPVSRNGAGHPGGKRILWLSNLFARKGVVPFIESLPNVITRNPDATVTVAGEWENAELRRKTTGLLESQGLSSRVAFIGKAGLEQKRALYREHDVFVLPPVQAEGMPWAILEAMSSGLPVISSAQGAIPDMVLDGVTGFVVRPTPENIASRLNFLLGNPQVSKRMGLEGRKRVEELFSRDAAMASLARVFHLAAAR